MTPSLIRTQYLGANFSKTSKVEKGPNGNVSIDLGHGIKLSCNRREDFEALIHLATEALTLLVP